MKLHLYSTTGRTLKYDNDEREIHDDGTITASVFERRACLFVRWCICFGGRLCALVPREWLWWPKEARVSGRYKEPCPPRVAWSEPSSMFVDFTFLFLAMLLTPVSASRLCLTGPSPKYNMSALAEMDNLRLARPFTRLLETVAANASRETAHPSCNYSLK